jgi:hypothetical protein
MAQKKGGQTDDPSGRKDCSIQKDSEEIHGKVIHTLSPKTVIMLAFSQAS